MSVCGLPFYFKGGSHMSNENLIGLTDLATCLKVCRTNEGDMQYALTDFASIEAFQREVKERRISKPEAFDIISNSVLYREFRTQDARYTQFYGQPEFRFFLHDYKEDLEVVKNERIINFIYDILINHFDVVSAKERKLPNTTERMVIRSFLLKSFKGFIIRKVLLPIGQERYPLATIYTTELLNLFHKSAGYEHHIAGYCIEDIAEHITNAYKTNAEKAGREEYTVCTLNMAYTVWEAYSPFNGNGPKFRKKKNQDKVFEHLKNVANTFTTNTSAVTAKRVISDELTYNMIIDIAKNLFSGDDLGDNSGDNYNFFVAWFDKCYFGNDCMSSSTGRACSKNHWDGLVKEGIVKDTWKNAQDRITKQRAELIAYLAKEGLVNIEALQDSDNSIYTKKLLVRTEKLTNTQIGLSERKNCKEKALNPIDFITERNRIYEKNTLAQNLLFDLKDMEISEDIIKFHAIG